MSGHSLRWLTRRPPRPGRNREGRRLVVVLLTFATAVSLGAVVYLASLSLPYFASSPLTDPLFGRQNHCLISALPEPRVGFAVSPDGALAAAYGATLVALCPRADEGARVLGLAGVRAAAFDWANALWLASAETGQQPAALWRLEAGGELEHVGELNALALAGHARGVAALDREGKLFSLGRGGEALGYARLPAPPLGGAQLVADPGGARLAVVAGGGLFLFRADTLAALRAEGPCQAEFLWWLPEPAAAVLACAPGASWALWLNADTGEKEAAPEGDRVRSTLVPGLGAYVQACEGLPCTAPPP